MVIAASTQTTDQGRRGRLAACAGLLAADLVVIALVLALTGRQDPGHVGYRVLLVSAVIAAVVMVLVWLVNAKAFDARASVGLRAGVLALCVFSGLQTLVTVLLLALAIVPDAGSDTVPLLAAGVIALFGLTFATTVTGRTWRALPRGRAPAATFDSSQHGEN